MKHGYLVLAMAASLVLDPLIARADDGWVPYGSRRIRRELREGAREIRREVRREIYRSNFW